VGIAALALATVAGGWRMAHRPVERGTVRLRVLPDPDERIRVEVLNGSGVTGLSRAVTQRLRNAGLDVVYFGNDTSGSSAALDTTQILVRQGDAAMGVRVQRALGIGAVLAAPDPARLVDVSVRLGRDYAAVVGNP
jgi:hypothetical protein